MFDNSQEEDSKSDVRGLEDQSGFPSGHFGFETAFVEGFAHGVDGAAGTAEGDETGAALEMALVGCGVSDRVYAGWGDLRRKRRRRHRNRWQELWPLL